MKSLSIMLMIILITSSTGVFNLNNAFANHVEYKTRDEMEQIDVNLIFVTSFGKCTLNHWNTLEGYETMTKYYLWKYNIVANTKIDCINKDSLNFAVDSSLSSYDLTIIIPDIVNSLEWLFVKSKLGHYSHNGNDRSILTEAITLNSDSDHSIWVLSHELSHFALEWYDYPLSVSVDEVHQRQSDYDTCIMNDPTGAHCRDLWETVESVVTEDESNGNGKKYRVMEPLRYERNIVSSSSYANPQLAQIPKDSDSDGISDYSDSCPNDSQNDADNDGYCGNVDKCPYETGVPSNGGCPTSNSYSRPITPSKTESAVPVISPLDRFTVKDFRVANGNSLRMPNNDIRVSNLLNFVLDVRNNQNREQPFAYLVQIQDSNGATVSNKWITSSISGGQSSSPSLSWTPTQAGTYTATAFGWESADNPTAVFAPISITFEVLPSIDNVNLQVLEIHEKYVDECNRLQQKSSPIINIEEIKQSFESSDARHRIQDEQSGTWVILYQNLFNKRCNDPLDPNDYYVQRIGEIPDSKVLAPFYDEIDKIQEYEPLIDKVLLGVIEAKQIEANYIVEKNKEQKNTLQQSENDVPKLESDSKSVCESGLKAVAGYCYRIEDNVVTSTNNVESNTDVFKKISAMFEGSTNSNGKICFLFWCW